MFWLTPLAKQLGQALLHIYDFELPTHLDREASPGVLIERLQHLERSPIVSGVNHEITGADVMQLRFGDTDRVEA